MTKSFKELTKNCSKYIQKFRGDMPELMKGFSNLASAATKDASLDKKQKELIALGIAVSGRCSACIGFHTKTLIELGATKEEIMETLGIAVYMGGGPSLMYAAEALQAMEEFQEN